jgi:hypothetical protein
MSYRYALALWLIHLLAPGTFGSALLRPRYLDRPPAGW